MCGCIYIIGRERERETERERERERELKAQRMGSCMGEEDKRGDV